MGRAVVPPAMAAIHRDWRMAPGRAAGGFLFLTGVTGVAPDGRLAEGDEAQIRTAFAQVGMVLGEAGLGWGDLVEVTSYHVGLAAHLAVFRAIWAEHVVAPYPAWTAIEVAGFATPGVIVELRAIAHGLEETP